MIQSYNHNFSPGSAQACPNQMPLFERVSTTHQIGWNHDRGTLSTVIFNLHDELLKSRVEIEGNVLQRIRERMIKSGDLRSHSLFLPLPVELCFYGCKFIEFLQEEFPYLNQSQVSKLANFLFEKRFLVPVMKFIGSFQNNAVLYRLNIDERNVQQNLTSERVRTYDLALEILKSFEIIPSTFKGQRLWEIVDEIGQRDVARFGGLMAKVQLQFLLLHGFISPENFISPEIDVDEEQYQLFNADLRYSICSDLSQEHEALTVDGQSFSEVESYLTIPENTGNEETCSTPKPRRKISVITTTVMAFLKLKDNNSNSEVPGPSRLKSKTPSLNVGDSPNGSPRSTMTQDPSQQLRPRGQGRSEKVRKRSNLQDFEIVNVDKDGNAIVVGPEELKPTVKPLEYNYKPLPENYEFIEWIDNGKFGNVYLCQDKPSQALMAVKQVHYDPESKKSQELFDSLMNEVEILKSAQHPNIVRYYGFNSYQGTFNIFMEFVEGGSMRRYIKVRGPLSRDETIESLAHILLGLSYLHRNFIIHRDLKGPNVLRSADGILKLADFGYSKKFDEENYENKTFSDVGTPYWMCPEIIRCLGYNNKCDVWAFGATCYEFLTGNPPYFHLEPCQAMYKIASKPMKDNLTFREGIKDEFKQLNTLMLRCFEMDPNLRPSVDEILTLPMFSSHVFRRRCIFYT